MIVDLIESSSNQRFVFASNKLRESIGASDLIVRAGVHWVLDAVACVNGTYALREALGDAGDMQALRSALRDPVLNPWPDAAPQAAVHVLICTSGKALLLARDEAAARAVNRLVTMRAAANAPGLDVCAAFAPLVADTAAALDEAIRLAFERHAAARRARPDPAARFAWAPPFAPCGTSGLPARSDAGSRGLRSHVALTKLAAAAGWERRVRHLLRGSGASLPYDIDDLSTLPGIDWLGVVHADGNGLGKIFQRFGQTLRERGLVAADGDARAYAAQFRDFSQAVEQCTEQSFVQALRRTPVLDLDGESFHPIYPVVLGGDDLTAIVAGRTAFAFTRAYLDAFETLTRGNEAITPISGGGLTASAGIAIVKPHYPFRSAYDLAEDLMHSAKCIKRLGEIDAALPPLSSIDAHVLYDSTNAGLAQIRARLDVGGDAQRARLYCRPWLLGDGVDAAARRFGAWIEQRRIAVLDAGVAALTARDDDERHRLPSSQAHRLRLALRRGSDVADSTLRTLQHRYDAAGWEALTHGDSLFFDDAEPWGGAAARATRFLDALELAGFVGADA